MGPVRASAQQTITLKVQSGIPPKDIFHEQFLSLAKKVEEPSAVLIPPSVMLIVYVATAGVSVVKLYAGAFGPGFLLSALFLIYIVAVCSWKPHLGPPLPKEERSMGWGKIL